MRGRTLRTETLDRSNARDLEPVVRILREAKLHSAKFCSPVSPSSTTGCETSRSEMERWKILHSAKDLKQKGRDSERVVRTFRETHAISAMASSTTKNSSLKSPSSITGSKQSTNITHRHLVWRIHTH